MSTGPLRVEDRVPNAPFREKVLETIEREGVTMAEIALRAGWMNGGRGDTSYLQRILGMRLWTATHRRGRTYVPKGPVEHMSYDAAVKLCDALNLDYTEMDL